LVVVVMGAGGATGEEIVPPVECCTALVTVTVCTHQETFSLCIN
jgi:uncharacterized membrane protein YkvI